METSQLYHHVVFRLTVYSMLAIIGGINIWGQQVTQPLQTQAQAIGGGGQPNVVISDILFSKDMPLGNTNAAAPTQLLYGTVPGGSGTNLPIAGNQFFVSVKIDNNTKKSAPAPYVYLTFNGRAYAEGPADRAIPAGQSVYRFLVGLTPSAGTYIFGATLKGSAAPAFTKAITVAASTTPVVRSVSIHPLTKTQYVPGDTVQLIAEATMSDGIKQRSDNKEYQNKFAWKNESPEPGITISPTGLVTFGADTINVPNPISGGTRFRVTRTDDPTITNALSTLVIVYPQHTPLSVSPASLTFTAGEDGGPNPAPQTVTVTSPTGEFTASITNKLSLVPWLTTQQPPPATGGPLQLKVIASSNGLSHNGSPFTATINIAIKDGQIVHIPVTMNIAAPPIFKILGFKVDKVDALGHAAEDVRSFGWSFSINAKNVNFEIHKKGEAAGSFYSKHFDAWDTTPIYLSPGDWTKKLDPNTTYGYSLTAQAATPVAGPTSDTASGEFMTSNFGSPTQLKVEVNAIPESAAHTLLAGTNNQVFVQYKLSALGGPVILNILPLAMAVNDAVPTVTNSSIGHARIYLTTGANDPRTTSLGSDIVFSANGQAFIVLSNLSESVRTITPGTPQYMTIVADITPKEDIVSGQKITLGLGDANQSSATWASQNGASVKGSYDIVANEKTSGNLIVPQAINSTGDGNGTIAGSYDMTVGAGRLLVSLCTPQPDGSCSPLPEPIRTAGTYNELMRFNLTAEGDNITVKDLEFVYDTNCNNSTATGPALLESADRAVTYAQWPAGNIPWLGFPAGKRSFKILGNSNATERGAGGFTTALTIGNGLTKTLSIIGDMSGCFGTGKVLRIGIGADPVYFGNQETRLKSGIVWATSADVAAGNAGTDDVTTASLPIHGPRLGDGGIDLAITGVSASPVQVVKMGDSMTLKIDVKNLGEENVAPDNLVRVFAWLTDRNGTVVDSQPSGTLIGYTPATINAGQSVTLDQFSPKDQPLQAFRYTIPPTVKAGSSYTLHARVEVGTDCQIRFIGTPSDCLWTSTIDEISGNNQAAGPTFTVASITATKDIDIQNPSTSTTPKTLHQATPAQSLADGTTVQMSGQFYLMSNGQLRPFASHDVFLAYGFSDAKVKTVSLKDLPPTAAFGKVIDFSTIQRYLDTHRLNPKHLVLGRKSDTDADGYMDWQEIVSGFNPVVAHIAGTSNDKLSAPLSQLAPF